MTTVIVYAGSNPEGVRAIFATRKAAVGFSGRTRDVVPYILHFDYLEEHMTGQYLVAVPAVTQHLTADVMSDLRKLIADDAHALTFQSFGQYRSALLKVIDDARAKGDAA